MNNIKFTVIFVLSLVFIFPFLLGFGIRNIPSVMMPEMNQSVKVYKGRPVELSFGAKNGLTGIVIRIKNIYHPYLDLNLKLFNQNGDLVSESSFANFELTEVYDYKMTFSPQNSQNYKLVISSNANESGSIEIYVDSNNNLGYQLLYQSDNLWLNGLLIYERWYGKII